MANTIALGGVATGNMKAQEAARATITAITTGESPRLLAMGANSGTIRAAVAVFDASSVRKTTKVAITSTTSQLGAPPNRLTICWAKKALVPLTCSTAERQSPPPNSSSTPHSVWRSISGQLATPEAPTATMAASATSESNWSRLPSSRESGCEKIQASTVTPKISRVRRRILVQSQTGCSSAASRLSRCCRLGLSSS